MSRPAATACRLLRVIALADPYGCASGPRYGLTHYGPLGVTTGTASVYRRPLPAANLKFLSSITADGREPSLTTQAASAVLVHEQAASAPTTSQLARLVSYESGVFVAQYSSNPAGGLDGRGATGGPAPLSQQAFYPGINDAFGADPTGKAFNTVVMTPFAVWGEATQATAIGQERAAIGRGETLFNERAFTVSGVAGLNDALGQPIIVATCASCHDAPNAGSHSLPRLMDIGVTGAAPPGLDVAGLPRYTLQCVAGPQAGRRFAVTDPGAALVSGRCADIGKIKVPDLRGLAARAPYFHNGSAAGLDTVVGFYNARFRIGLTAQEQADMVAFLRAL